MLERIDHTSRDLTRYTLGSLVFYYDFKKAVSYCDTDELTMYSLVIYSEPTSFLKD